MGRKFAFYLSGVDREAVVKDTTTNELVIKTGRRDVTDEIVLSETDQARIAAWWLLRPDNQSTPAVIFKAAAEGRPYRLKVGALPTTSGEDNRTAKYRRRSPERRVTKGEGNKRATGVRRRKTATRRSTGGQT